MTRRTHIIAFDTGMAETKTGDEFLLTDELAEATEDPASTSGEHFLDEEEPKPSRDLSWIAPVLALAAAIAWTAFFVWSNLPRLTGATDAAGLSLALSQWATPVLLIAVLWLLVMRSSSREARRFGDAAQELSRESGLLEHRLTTVNRELSLAREFIAAQSRDLDMLGRVAGDRLSKHAERLHGLIHENSTRLDAIGTVSEAALDNMEKLRGQLPVIASSTKDLTNAIGTAGRTAHGQLEQLIKGFERVNEFGVASERQVAALTASITHTHDEFVRQHALVEQAVENRLAELRRHGEGLSSELTVHEEEALAAMRTRASAIAEELAAARRTLEAHEGEMLVSLRSRMATLRDEGTALARSLRDGEQRAGEAWQATVGAIGTQIAAFDEQVAERQTAHAARAAELSATGELAVAAFTDLEQRLAGIVGTIAESAQAAESSSTTLMQQLESSRTTLGTVSADVSQLTDSSVRLLEIIQAAAQHSHDQLPVALGAGEEALRAFEGRTRALSDMVGTARDQGEEIDRLVQQAQQRLASLSGEFGEFSGVVAHNGSEHEATLSRLKQEMADLAAGSSEAARHASDALAAAIERLHGSAREAVTSLAEASAPAVSQLADRLGRDSAAAIDKAMRTSADETAGKLEQSAAHAAGVAREAAVQLRDQLTKVNELVVNLERRVVHARERAEEQVDSDFARRAALITESLNSNAIDIAKALSSETSDTAWAAYLRGDRGVFTRRAVRLIDSSEARSIAEVYETDLEFRDHVNRYVHDFEAILRQVLSARDGNALGVTMLSSDMGKLYVALAQAIERFRA